MNNFIDAIIDKAESENMIGRQYKSIKEKNGITYVVEYSVRTSMTKEEEFHEACIRG